MVIKLKNASESSTAVGRRWSQIPKSKTTNEQLADYMHQTGWAKSPQEIHTNLSKKQQEARQAVLATPTTYHRGRWASLPTSPKFKAAVHPRNGNGNGKKK